MSKKNIIISILTILILYTFAVFPKQMISASSKGLMLWYKNVIPSIFIFMTGVSILSLTGFSKTFGKIFKNIMPSIFGISKECAFCWISGTISGSPLGAKVTADLYKNGIIKRSDAQKCLAISNNTSPLFIIGTVGATMLGYEKWGYFILFIIFISSISTGIILRFIPIKENNTLEKYMEKETIQKLSIGEILKKSIYSSTETVVMIGGFIVLFSVITESFELLGVTDTLCEIIPISKEYISGILSGILEITYGCNKISSTDLDLFTKIISMTFILSFGGISVNLQAISLFSSTDLSPIIFILSKILNSIFSIIYTFIFYGLFENQIQKTVPTAIITDGTAISSNTYVLISLIILLLGLLNCIYIKIK